ncbi:esterase, partial [Shigella sonnei]
RALSEHKTLSISWSHYHHLWGGDTHSESAWAKRFPEMLKLFYC